MSQPRLRREWRGVLPRSDERARCVFPVGSRRRAAEFSPALRGHRALEVAGGASSALWKAAGARGESGLGIDAEDGCRAEGVGRFAQAAGGSCGAQSSGPTATRISLGKPLSEKAGLAGSAFLFHAILRAEKFAGLSFERREAKAHGSGGDESARAANVKSAASVQSSEARPLQARTKRVSAKCEGRAAVARLSAYFFFFFCSRRHCHGGVGSLSCQRPRRSLRAMASSSFQVLQMSLVQK